MQHSCTPKMQTPSIHCHFLSLTIFLQHSASQVSDSPNTQSKNLNSKTCSNHVLSKKTSHTNPSSSPNIITLLLFAFTFRPLLLHTLAKHLTISSRFSPISPHKTRSSAYISLSNLYSFPSSENVIPILPIPIFIFFITRYLYTLKSQRDMTYPFLTPLSILKHLLSPPFSQVYHPHHTFSIPATVSLLTLQLFKIYIHNLFLLPCFLTYLLHNDNST